MSKSLLNTICKFVSILFVLLAVLMLFRGSITIADKDDKRELKKSMRDAYNEMEDVDPDDIDEMQDTLDNYDIDINAKTFYKQLRKLITVLRDGEISPYEIASSGPTLISLSSKFQEYDELRYYVHPFEEILDAVDDNKFGIIISILLFVMSVVCGLAICILHILDKKMSGISLVIMNIIWLLILGIATARINNWVEMEMDYDDKFLRLTAAPFVAIIFAIIAMVIWMFKDRIIEQSGNLAPAPAVKAADVYTATGARVCPNCGKTMNPGAIFCSGCGSKYVEPKAPVPGAEVDEKIFCPNCGVQLSSDSEFCPNCGNKIR